MRKILKSIFQTLDKWVQKLSSNFGSNSIILFFALKNIEFNLGKKQLRRQDIFLQLYLLTSG